MSAERVRELPLAPQVAALRSGARPVIAEVEHALERMVALEPSLHAFVEEPGRAARLAAEASMLAQRWPDANRRPPLFGVPVGVKDVYHVDGLPTGAGSRLPAGVFTGDEASCVRRLRDAGALVLGKTQSSELAYVAPAPTRNPHDTRRTPGGSSSGSAAAVAAGMCAVALGTQTTRSVIAPAAFCGVVGHVPSRGRCPTAGIVPLSPSLDRPGWFVQDVGALALVGATLCDGWRLHDVVPRPTLGVPDGAFLEPVEQPAREAFEQQVAALAAAGYAVVRVPFPTADGPRTLHRAALALLHAELAAEHAGHRDGLRPETVVGIARGLATTPGTLEAARAEAAVWPDRFVADTRRHRIDCWICPAANGPAPMGDGPPGYDHMHIAWSLAGAPAVTLPLARSTDGLPLGLQLVATPGDDERLVAWAVAVAAALGA